MSRAARPAAVASLVLTLLLIAACTSVRGGDHGLSAGGTTGDRAGLTGAPIVLGVVTQEDSPNGSFPEARIGALAATGYANRTLKGVGGRPLEIRSCRTDGSPESSQRCAQQLIAARPFAVIGGIDLGATSALPQYAAAKIPYVTGSPQLLPELSDANSYALTGGTAAELLGSITSLIDARVKRISALYVDLPGLLSTAAQLAKAALDKKGIATRLVPEKTDAADFTPALTSAASGHPDALLIVFPPTSCARILQAATGIGLQVPLYLPGACATPEVLLTTGSLDVRFASSFEAITASGGSAELRAFRDALPIPDRTPEAQATWSSVLVVRALLTRLGPGATPVQLATALGKARGEPLPMGHPFSCTHPLPFLTSVCNTNVRLLRARDGGVVDVGRGWVDGGPLVSAFAAG